MLSEQKGCKFRRLRLNGYRSFSAEIDLRDLGDTVVLYGLNNTGKTNLLRALRFLARLIAQPISKLLDLAFENAKNFYDRLGEDRWMFAHNSKRIELETLIAPLEHSLRFEISIRESGINARLLEWQTKENSHTVDLLADAVSARDELLAAAEDREASQAAIDRFEAVKARWVELQQKVCVASSQHMVPISQELRDSLTLRSRSSDVSQRARASKVQAVFSSIVSGLPPGKLDSLLDDEGRNDFGWLTKAGIVPLNHLGSGAQALFGLLVSLSEKDSLVLLIDEPETHLNVIQQDALLAELHDIQTEFGISQIFIASHSVRFARPQMDIRLLERPGDHIVVSQRLAADLKRFESRIEGVRDATVSMLAYDNTVEIPTYVRETLGLVAGQYVYFVKGGDNKYSIISQATMDGMIGKNE
jgi:hypothetical protein